MKLPLKTAGQAFAGGARNNRDRCRNCEILETRIHNAKQTSREIRRELRRVARYLRTKRYKTSVILLAVVAIRCDPGSPKLNLRAIEEKIKDPAFMRESIDVANTIVSMVDLYRDEEGDLDTDFQDEDEE